MGNFFLLPMIVCFKNCPRILLLVLAIWSHDLLTSQCNIRTPPKHSQIVMCLFELCSAKAAPERTIKPHGGKRVGGQSRREKRMVLFVIQTWNKLHFYEHSGSKAHPCNFLMFTIYFVLEFLVLKFGVTFEPRCFIDKFVCTSRCR